VSARALLSLNINQTRDELEKVAREISDLHETLRVKDNALKLAETRLENRTNRSNCSELEAISVAHVFPP
jgi:Tektin family